MINTFQEFKQSDVSEKLMVAHLEPGRRIMLWSVHSGSIYKKVVDQYVVNMYENGVELTAVASLAALNSAGKWYFDPDTYTVYVRATDSGDPGDKDHFTMAIVRLFVANIPIDLPFDLDAGKEVPYEGIVENSSQFGAELDQERKGTALESTGSLTLYNASGFFDKTFDKYIWEGRDIAIYLMPVVDDRRALVEEKILLFRGLIVNKQFAPYTATFELANFIFKLREDVSLPRYTAADFDASKGEGNSDLLPVTVETIGGDVELATFGLGALKRRVYGRVAGLKLPSAQRVEDNGIKLTGTFSSISRSVHVEISTTVQGAAPSTNEVQLIQFYEDSTLATNIIPQGGTYRLTYNGETTASIPYNANAARIEQELEALPSIVDVNVTGSVAAGFSVTFISVLPGPYPADIPQLTVSSNALSVFELSRLVGTGSNIHTELSPGDELIAVGNQESTSLDASRITSVTVETLSRINIRAQTQMTVDIIKHTGYAEIVGVSSQFDTTVVKQILDAGGKVTVTIKGRNFKTKNIGVWNVTAIPVSGVMRIVKQEGDPHGETDTNVPINDGDTNYDITAISGYNNVITLAGELTNPIANKALWAIPNTPSTGKNRKFFGTHHICSQPSTTITAFDAPNQRVVVADATGLNVGDYLLLDDSHEVALTRIEGNTLYVSKVEDTDDNIVSILGTLSIGDTVVRPAVQKVYHSKERPGIKDKPFEKRLRVGRDFSITNAVSGLNITFNNAAEFNATAIDSFADVELFWTNGSRVVYSLNGGFDKLKKESNVAGTRAWISHNSGSSWYEVEEVVDKQLLIIRQTFTGTTGNYTTQYKNVEYITDTSVISADLYGMPTGTSANSPLIRTPSQVVKHLLEEAGLGNQINTTTFDQALIDANFLVSLALPLPGEGLQGQETDEGVSTGITRRDVVGLINDTIFGSLYNDLDFEICYKILTAQRSENLALRIDDTDVIDWSIQVYSDRIIKEVIVGYQHGDVNYKTLKEPYNLVESFVNNEVGYSLKSKEKLRVETYLYNKSEAQYMAQKYGFVNAESANLITVRTKLQTIDLVLNDLVRVRFDRLFERFGTSPGSRERIGVVNSIKKTESGVELTIDDLGNIFTRGGSVAEDGIGDWASTTPEERLYGLWLTNDNGIIGSDDNSHGLNLFS